MMTAVTGASASGKSAFAERCLMDVGEKRRIYAATMIAWDEECRERIKKHRAMRREKKFETVECPVDLLKMEIPEHCAVLLECVSNLAANEMYRENLKDGQEEGDGQNPKLRARGAGRRILDGIRRLKDQTDDLVVVTNEVFCEPGVYGEETECYRKLLGKLNREIFKMADQVFEVVCGIPVLLEKIQREYCSEDGNLHMKLITGGAYQGKTEFAFRLLGQEKDLSLVADGAKDRFSAAMEKRIIINFHEYVRRFAGMEAGEAGKKMREFTEQVIRENPGVIVTADEIGSGIVPLDGKDRLWRDLEGEAMQMLAHEADDVYRVIGGLSQVLKGGSL